MYRARSQPAALMAADLMDVGEWMQLKRYDARVVPRSSGGAPVQRFIWLCRREAQPEERPERRREAQPEERPVRGQIPDGCR